MLYMKTAFLKVDIVVFSNAKNYSQDPLAPLNVPTVNLSHFDVIPHPRKSYKLREGFLVCNGNCAVTEPAMPFAVTEAAYNPVDVISVATEQALSGTGYSGNAIGSQRYCGSLDGSTREPCMVVASVAGGANRELERSIFLAHVEHSHITFGSVSTSGPENSSINSIRSHK